LMLLDISPTLTMYEQTSMAFATAYWHWFFLIQPAPLPETLINANPDFYLRAYMGRRSTGLSPFTEDAWAEYARAMSDPACVHAMCEDYRAAATIDLEHDRADREVGRKVQCPVRVLWGKRGVIERCFDPLNDWRRVAENVSGRALDCGHYIPEEAPAALIEEIENFL
jgi:haloacetate dehalogenase